MERWERLTLQKALDGMQVTRWPCCLEHGESVMLQL